MKEYSFDSSIDTNPSAPLPHFDDERTLLTARRVVPLEKINAKVRQRRTWFLGGAFALAMMLGAASALVVSYLRLRSVPAAANEISQPEDVPAPLVVAESVPAETPVVEEPGPATAQVVAAEAPK